MLLYEVREKLNNKREEWESNPNEKPENVNYIKAVCKLFDDRDAILEAPKSMIVTALLCAGYDSDKLSEIYDQLIRELSQKIVLVDPDMVSDLIDSIRK